MFSRVFSILFIFISGLSAAQTTPALERTVTLSASNERVDTFLKRLSVESGCVFSYSSTAFDVNRTITHDFREQTTREVLETIFDGHVYIKPKGTYVILSPTPRSTKEVIVSGYVVDESSGEKLREATVYNPVTLRSTTTDEFGYFQLRLKNPSPDDYKLMIKKVAYTDTLVFAPERRSSFQKFSLRIDKDKLSATADDLTNPAEKFWAWTKNSVARINLNNVRDTLNSTWQVSLVPFIGTNRKMSGNITNDYSLNLLGGYSAGTNKIEFGGLFNITTGAAEHVQIAGMFNLAGGTVRGFQLAGITNMNQDSTHAAQVAGLVNLNTNLTKGFQLGGLANINQDSVNAVVIAGFANITSRSAQGFQLAGFTNITAKEFKGVQVAGFANIAGKNIHGTQIAGFLNLAKDVRGSQIGFINISKTHQGVPLGFLSFVSKGYHSIELGADEIVPLNLSFRTGVRPLYTILMVGVRPENADSTTWAFGYGIGSSPRLGNKQFLNFELTAQQFNKGNVEALNLFNRFYIGFEQKLGNTFALYAGPALTLRVYDTAYDHHPSTFSYYSPTILAERNYADQSRAWQLWAGFRFGVRIF
jgi:hypothetical protein